MSDPIRSLRVAGTLADRFRALLQPGLMESSDLEIAIGEAQRIYPEIWRHLDEARTALVAMERDVSAFDALRVHELGILGVTQIDSSLQLDMMSLMLGRLRVAEVKTATFNYAGYQRAVAACRALMDTMPEVDWAELARAEDREIAAAGSLHASKWSGMVKAAAIAAALVGVAYGVYQLVSHPPRDQSASPKTSAKVTAAAPIAASTAPPRRPEDDARDARIAELRADYRTRCDPAVREELLALLRSVSPSEAANLAMMPCTPYRPTCDEFRDELTSRVAEQLELDPNKLQLRCDGVLLAIPGRVGPALVVTFAAGGKLMRGVVSDLGREDIIPFAPAPAGAKLITLGDIDDDTGEELVFATEHALVVTKLAATGFVDIPGPVMKGSCSADITTQRDFRDGRDGSTRRLVLTGPPDARRACLSPGPHFYTLADGALVETR